MNLYVKNIDKKHQAYRRVSVATVSSDGTMLASMKICCALYKGCIKMYTEIHQYMPNIQGNTIKYIHTAFECISNAFMF